MVRTRLAPWLVKIFIWHNHCEYHDHLQCCLHLNLCCLLQHFLCYHQNICLWLFLNNNSFDQFNNIWFKKSSWAELVGASHKLSSSDVPLLSALIIWDEWILLSNKQDIRLWYLPVLLESLVIESNFSMTPLSFPSNWHERWSQWCSSIWITSCSMVFLLVWDRKKFNKWLYPVWRGN